MKRHFFKNASLLGALFLTLAVLAGCSKKEEASSITVAMPEWSKLTGKNGKSEVGSLSTIKVVSRVMINISGPDIVNQIVYIWDLNSVYQGGATIPEPPAEHTLTVPRGSNRLIQVLAIIEEMDTEQGSSGGQMSFYYGETVKSIANAVVPVSIALAAESTASAGEGSISGRYFFSDGSTPTGPVDMYYAPIGRRPMVVESTSVFSGHFHFFLLPTIPFTFQMRNSGISLFKNVTTSSFTSLHSEQLLQIDVPAGYRERGGSSSREYRPKRTKIVGFVGPGATLTSRRVCYTDLSGPLTGFYTTAAGSTEILWSPASASTDDIRIPGGGYGSSVGTCDPPYDTFGYTNYDLSIDNIATGDSPIDGRGPFAALYPGGTERSYLTGKVVSGNKVEYEWSYLHGVAGQSVDGVGLFYKVFSATEKMDDRWHDNAPCNQLQNLGFTEITRVPVGANPSSPVTKYEWTPPNVTAFNDGKLKAVICPYTNSKPGYYDFAVSHYVRSGGSYPTATKISVSSVTEPNVVTAAGARQYVSENTCTVLRIATTDASGNVLRRANTNGSTQVSVQIVGAPAGAKLYSNPNCTSPVSGVSSLNPFLNGEVGVVSILADNTVTDIDVAVTDITSGGTPLPAMTHFLTRISPQSATEIRTVVRPAIKSWQCYPIGFLRGRMGATVFIGESGSVGTVYEVPLSNLTYYNDDQCMSISSPGLLLAANQTFNMKFFRYTGSDTSLNLSPDITEFAGLSQGTTTVSVSAPAAPSNVRYEISNNVGVNACNPFKLVLNNSQNEFSPHGSDVVVTYNFSTSPAAGEGFFTDSGCSVQAGPSVTITSGSIKSDTLYFRWTSAISPLTLGGTSTLPVSNVNISVGP